MLIAAMTTMITIMAPIIADQMLLDNKSVKNSKMSCPRFHHGLSSAVVSFLVDSMLEMLNVRPSLM